MSKWHGGEPQSSYEKLTRACIFNFIYFGTKKLERLLGFIFIMYEKFLFKKTMWFRNIKPRHVCARNSKQINIQTKKARDEDRVRRNDVAVNRRVAMYHYFLVNNNAFLTFKMKSKLLWNNLTQYLDYKNKGENWNIGAGHGVRIPTRLVVS